MLALVWDFLYEPYNVRNGRVEDTHDYWAMGGRPWITQHVWPRHTPCLPADHMVGGPALAYLEMVGAQRCAQCYTIRHHGTLLPQLQLVPANGESPTHYARVIACVGLP